MSLFFTLSVAELMQSGFTGSNGVAGGPRDVAVINVECQCRGDARRQWRNRK